MLPYTRPDGSPYQQSGYSHLVDAGNGRLRYAEDMMNAGHIADDLAEAGWVPSPGMQPAPERPNRDFSVPAS